MFLKRKKAVECASQLLFDILSDDLRDGLCTDIHFVVDGQKHRFGAWGDNGETKKNVVYYMDKSEFGSYEELKSGAAINGRNLYESNVTVTVTECNGCYPESTPRLFALMEKQ